MGAVVAVILMKERQVVDAFMRADAITAESARTLDDLGVSAHGAAWRILVDRAILRSPGDGRYFVDVQSWEAAIRTRRRRLLVFLVLFVAIALWFLGPWRR